MLQPLTRPSFVDGVALYTRYLGPERYKNEPRYIGASSNKLNHAQLFRAQHRAFVHLDFENDADSQFVFTTNLSERFNPSNTFNFGPELRPSRISPAAPAAFPARAVDAERSTFVQ